jgi:hypothetical protein
MFFKFKFDKNSLVRKSLLLHHGSETYGTTLVHPYSWRPLKGGSHIHQGLSNNMKSTPLIPLNFQFLIFVDFLIMKILNNSCIATLNITTHPFSQSLGFGRSQCAKPPKTDKLFIIRKSLTPKPYRMKLICLFVWGLHYLPPLPTTLSFGNPCNYCLFNFDVLLWVINY